MFKVVNNATGETLLKTSDQISLTIVINNIDRIIVTANREKVSAYLRDLTRDRAEVQVTRSKSGLYNIMEI